MKRTSNSSATSCMIIEGHTAAQTGLAQAPPTLAQENRERLYGGWKFESAGPPLPAGPTDFSATNIPSQRLNTRTRSLYFAMRMGNGEWRVYIRGRSPEFFKGWPRLPRCTCSDASLLRRKPQRRVRVSVARATAVPAHCSEGFRLSSSRILVVKEGAPGRIAICLVRFGLYHSVEYDIGRGQNH